MDAGVQARLDRMDADGATRAAELAAAQARHRRDVDAQMASMQAGVAALLNAELEVALARHRRDVDAQMASMQADVAALRNADLETALARHRRDVDAQMARVQEDLAAALSGGGPLHPTARRSAKRADRSPPLPADLAGLYAAFEDRFRGSREAIIERVREHLPIVEAAGAGTADRPVLDLGCGRGEWLEVLREAGLRGRGVDSNPVLVEQCRGRGLDVAFGDVLAHLRGLPDASVGAVTAVHVVEHLPFTTLVDLVDETVRVLAPGGVAIFETPNVQHLLVGACAFHTDPTHELPLAPDGAAVSRRGARSGPRRDPLPAPPCTAAAAARRRARRTAPAGAVSRGGGGLCRHRLPELKVSPRADSEISSHP